MKIHFNAPVILTFTLICVFVAVVNEFLFPTLTQSFFTVYPNVQPASPLWYFRLISHTIGHGGFGHLTGNFSFILLLGPIVEEKYGSKKLLYMILITAVITGLLNAIFFNTALLGASGIVFMFILLSSFTNFKSGQIPLTFILVATLFLSKEIINAFSSDNISQFAHILGGITGSIFGFKMGRRG